MGNLFGPGSMVAAAVENLVAGGNTRSALQAAFSAGINGVFGGPVGGCINARIAGGSCGAGARDAMISAGIDAARTAAWEYVESAGGIGGAQTNRPDQPRNKSTETTPEGGSRKLTSGEITLAKEVFGESINYEEVKVYRVKVYFFQPADTTMAPDGNIYFHPQSPNYREDFSQADVNLQAHFIHELTHVLQTQSGINVRTAAFDRNYSYTLTTGKDFSDYGLEQQGNIARDYFYMRRGVIPPGNPGTKEQFEALLPFRLRK